MGYAVPGLGHRGRRPRARWPGSTTPAARCWRRSLGRPVGLFLTGSALGLSRRTSCASSRSGLQTVDASLLRVSPSLDDAARSLGAGTGGVLRRVHLPHHAARPRHRADPRLRRDHEGDAGDPAAAAVRAQHAVGRGVGAHVRGAVAGGRGPGARDRRRRARAGDSRDPVDVARGAPEGTAAEGRPATPTPMHCARRPRGQRATAPHMRDRPAATTAPSLGACGRALSAARPSETRAR